MEENGMKLSHDLANWMGNLPENLKNTPIIHLAIPGSHDSMTYSMTASSGVAPDAETIIKRLTYLGYPAKYVIQRWSVTQNCDVHAQLVNGIRYFDLRVATKPSATKSEFYFCHALYCHAIEHSLAHINTFLTTHPNEVVILDFQHFYAFTHADHATLLDLIERSFPGKLSPFRNFIALTLNKMTQTGHQVIVVYRSRESRPFCTPSAYFPTPWGQTTSLARLLTFLNDGLHKRDVKFGFVSQCLLTPTPAFVLRNVFKTLKTTCGLAIRQSVLQWLAGHGPGENGRVNVVIADFVELDGFGFCRMVVELNGKLL